VRGRARAFQEGTLTAFECPAECPMKNRPYFVSLHHQIRLDENLPPLAHLDARAISIITAAAGVLMPKYCSPARYRLLLSLARASFPNLAPRFACRGKARQALLFKRLGIPHPETRIFSNAREAVEAVREGVEPARPFPFVLKGDKGGGGSAVFPVHTPTDLLERLAGLPPDEPLVFQEWIQNGGRDLRVVIMGEKTRSYFRVGGDSFYNNVSKGARIDFGLDPSKQQEGVRLARKTAERLHIDLAAFDIMFPIDGSPPLVIEINFLFGKKGLGGMKGYDLMYRQAVDEWMHGVLRGPQGVGGLSTKRVRPSRPVTRTVSPSSTGGEASCKEARHNSPRTRT